MANEDSTVNPSVTREEFESLKAIVGRVAATSITSAELEPYAKASDVAELASRVEVLQATFVTAPAAAPPEDPLAAWQMPAIEDLAHHYDGKALQPTHDLAETIRRAHYGFTYAGNQAVSGKQLKEVWDSLNADRAAFLAGRIPEDYVLTPGGDVMRPETYAFVVLTGLAKVPGHRDPVFIGLMPEAQFEPRQFGPKTIEDILNDEWSRGTAHTV